MWYRNCRWQFHRPVRTQDDSSIFLHEAGYPRRSPLPCEKMQANLSISAKPEFFQIYINIGRSAQKDVRSLHDFGHLFFVNPSPVAHPARLC